MHIRGDRIVADAATPIETCFRHSWWQQQREKIAAALSAAGVRPGRQERFAQCGCEAMVWQCDQTADYEVRCTHCRDRFCRACGRERGRIISHNLEAQIEKVIGPTNGRRNQHRVLMVTLTVVSTPDGLEDRIDHLYKSFARLRRHRLFKKRVRGGAATFECTWNSTTAQHHPHLHCLWECDWFPIAELREMWHQATGDSHIVDIRAVRSPEGAARELTKYMGKPIHSSLPQDEATIVDMIHALHGRHLCLTHGTWRGLHLLDPPERTDDTTWTCLGSLDGLFHRARDGEPAARRCVDALERRSPRWNGVYELGHGSGP